MPHASRKICPHAGCSTLVLSGRCSKHAKQDHKAYNKQRPDTDRQYWTAQWKKFRDHYLSMHPLCVMCNKSGLYKIAELIDHIKPVKDGGGMYDLNNLQSLCNDCHVVKTAADSRAKRV